MVKIKTQLPTSPRLILQGTLLETKCTDGSTTPIHTIPALPNKTLEWDHLYTTNKIKQTFKRERERLREARLL